MKWVTRKYELKKEKKNEIIKKLTIFPKENNF